MDYPAQRIYIPEEDREGIFDKMEEVFDNGMLAYGRYVDKFEKAWAEVCGTDYAIATTSCTTALEILIRSLNIPKRKKILVPTNTYVASAQACLNAGHEVKLWEIGKDLNLDIKDLHIKNLEDVGGVMIVHIGGNVSPDILDLVDLCREANIPLIEDCAHAHGVEGVGKYGIGGCFSFYPTKLITCGEGGMLVTNDISVNEFARMYRHHGRFNFVNPITYGIKDCEYLIPGSNYCMDELRAIVGLSQVGRLRKYIRNRREIAEIYKEKFSCIDTPGTNYYKFITYDNLKVNGNVQLSGKVYDNPLHTISYLQTEEEKNRNRLLDHLKYWSNNSYPRAHRYCQFHKCIPIYNDQTPEEAHEIMESIEVVK